MSTVAQAVAKKQAEVEQVEAVDPQQVVGALIRRYEGQIAKLLKDTGTTAETFVAQVANACRAVPELWSCVPETILGAALRAAQLGLAPNDVRNLCWILPYWDNSGEQRVRNAQFQLGYGGVMELARRAVDGLKFDGRPVYPNDEFDVDYGRTPPMRHVPFFSLGRQRGGDPTVWYVRARFPDGDELIHALDKEGVEYHRSFSKQRDGMMWTKSYDAAALKSVVKDMRRWLPSSAQLIAGLDSDETVHDVRTIGPIDHVPARTVDVVTGEITEVSEAPPASEPAEGPAEPPTTPAPETAEPAPQPTNDDDADELFRQQAKGGKK